jgi:hypothetical protein
MKRTLCIFVGLLPLTASAGIEIVPDATPPAVFAARPQTISVTLRNPDGKTAEADVHTRLFQLTSGSVVPVGEAQPWKKIQVLPRQTVLETLTLTFPEVRTVTCFRLELSGIGRTEVMVYPNDLLKRLKTLAGELPLGVFDPERRLKPLLKVAGVKIADFETEPTDSKLVIVWAATASLPDSVSNRVKTGIAAVWIRPSLMPTTYAARLGGGIVVVAPASSLQGLADSPLPQLNLIRDAELALEPDALRLPSDNQPQ